MSLVDYASSDEEDEVGREGRNNDNLVISHPKPPPPNEKSTRLPVEQSDNSRNHSEPSTYRLPDASFLLDSPSLPSNMIGSYDHTSRVAAAMAQNESRKRDSKESTASYPRGKIPRGNLPHSKHVPETAHGLLRPPQLSGRSGLLTLGRRADLNQGVNSRIRQLGRKLHRELCLSAVNYFLGVLESNVVTEDINKLFTRRNGSEPSSSRSPSEC